MAKIDSFSSKSKFFGDKYFSYGVARSGEFTLHQVALLETYGTAYEALYTGERTPATREEEDFVKVFHGKREASTEHEKVWALLLDKTQNRRVVSAFGSTPVDTSSIVVEEDDVLEDD